MELAPKDTPPHGTPLSTRLHAALLLALVAVLCAGCHLPLRRTHAGTKNTTGGPPPGWQRDGVAKQILLYVPNRIVDLLDIVKVGIGVGLAAGPDIRITQWGQLAVQAGIGAGVQWDGRDHKPGVYTAEATVAFGPWRTGAGVGHVASTRPFEIAIAGGGSKLGVDLAEIADFVLGWFFVDFQQDDYGWTRLKGG
jgi:hypothetical protein